MATKKYVSRHDIGRMGEDHAEEYLRSAGWDVVHRNWRCSEGEIDIIAKDGDTLVVVEVKTRRSHVFGPPQLAVTSRKMARLRTLAGVYLGAQEERFRHIRIDVIAITMPPGAPAHIEHLVGVT